MALRNAILAALTDNESSGYDLAKAFNVAVSHFWTATPQQLYRELEKMEAAGLVQARVVEQERRPNKRLFSLTDAGRRALHDFTTGTPKPMAIRDELLVQITAMELADIPSLRIAVQARLEAAERKLKQYERSREYLLDGRNEADYLAQQPSQLGRYLTLVRGIAFEQENFRWCGLVLRTLAQDSPADPR
ncbi:PadR family transcriptional regulator [Streptomyces sp. NPDC050263]|uniref:PadR family transcriptional regulator n=1 Tax=Streptomyces sp. NPDC050263 TaxID=3155037 RepID=UPI00342A43E9